MIKNLFAFIFSFTTVFAQAQAQKPIKGVWLTNSASNALNSRENIKQTVDLCSKSGINTIFMVVWNCGYTMYKSDVMKKEFGVAIAPVYKERDPLQELIEEAAKKNIDVHAWFEFGFAASYGKFGKHILEKHPEWAALNKEGKPVVKNEFAWMNAFDPKVQNFVQSLVLEVAKKYKVKGVQGDDRLPALPSSAGYDSLTVSMYAAEHNGNKPPTNYKDSAWLTWRANKLTAFLQVLYKNVKNINPKILVTTAPNLYPWAKEEYLQDWPTWVDKKCTDMVFVQLYRYNIEGYKKILNDMVAQAGKNMPIVYPGILLSLGNGYLAKKDMLIEMINANRKAGIKGEVFFYYEGINKMKDFFIHEYPKL